MSRLLALRAFEPDMETRCGDFYTFFAAKLHTNCANWHEFQQIQKGADFSKIVGLAYYNPLMLK